MVRNAPRLSAFYEDRRSWTISSTRSSFQCFQKKQVARRFHLVDQMQIPLTEIEAGIH